MVLNDGTGRSLGPPTPGITGSSTRDGVASPRWSENVAGNGEGQITGHAADATETRIE